MAALEQVQELLALLSEIKDLPLNRESCKYFAIYLYILSHFIRLYL